MSGETSDLKRALGTLAQASVRHNEYLDISTMNVGEPGESEPAKSQPRIHVDIEQPLPGDREALRMGTVSAQPIYDSDAVFGDPTTEEQLQDALTGYMVSIELRVNKQLDSWPPYDIDYESLGFARFDDESDIILDFGARTETMPFEDAIDLVHETVSVLREHREQ